MQLSKIASFILLFFILNALAYKGKKQKSPLEKGHPDYHKLNDDKPQMIFIKIREKFYPGNEKGMEEIARNSNELLRSGGVETQIYVVETDKLLVVTNGTSNARKILDYSKEREEILYTEWNQNKVEGSYITKEERKTIKHKKERKQEL